MASQVGGKRSQSYKNGRCDFCKLKNVQIRPLYCKKHFYCRVCEEFCPKLRKGDFKCTTCNRKEHEEHRQKVDDFVAKQTGMHSKKKNRFQEVTVSLAGANVITFGEKIEKEDDDLDGNNDEWEHLLQSMQVENQQHSPAQSDMSRSQTRDHEKRKSIKRKQERTCYDAQNSEQCFEFILPSAEIPDGSQAISETPFNKTEMSSDVQKRSSLNREKRINSWYEKKVSSSNEPPSADTSGEIQLERGTSPVKSRRSAFSWLGLIDEEGNLANDHVIESPDTGESSALDHNDDEFWNF